MLLIVDDHIVKSTNNVFQDGFPRREHDCKLKKAKWECNYRRYRKILNVFMPEKVHHLKYETGLQEIAILELDRAFSDVGDVSQCSSKSLSYYVI